MTRFHTEPQYLIELEAHDGVTYGFATGRGFAPTDPDAALYRGQYDGRVSSEARLTVRRQTDGAGSSSGAAGQDFGAISLDNSDGALDALGEKGFDGRALRIIFAPAGARAMTECEPVYRGTVTELQVQRLKVTITLRDRLEELNTPIGSTVDAAEWPDADGERLPVVAGAAVSVPLFWLDRVLLIAAVHDGAATVSGVFDLGVALTAGSDYADMAAMKSTAPASGQYRVLSTASGAFVRLGSRPQDHDKITADVATATIDGPSQLQAVAQKAPTIGAGDVSASSFTALSRAWSVGGWWPGETPVLDAASEIARSLGAVIFFDRLGKLSAARLTPEAGAGVISIYGPQNRSPGGGARRATELDRVRLGKPAKEISVGYAKSHAVFSDLGALWDTAPARAERISRDYARSVVEGAGVASKHLLASSMRLDTILNDKTQAETVAEELRAAQGAWFHSVIIPADEAAFEALDLGVRVDIHESRWSGAAISTVVREIAHDLTAGTITLGVRE